MNKAALSSPPFGSTLIVGAGPAGIHVAVDLAQGWCGPLGLLNRAGAHADLICEELARNGNTLSSEVEAVPYRHLSRTAVLTCFYGTLAPVEDIWDTIILCTPSDSYAEVADRLGIEGLLRLRRILLISPGIGSNLLVQSRLRAAQERVEVISFSTYYAATRFSPDRTSVLRSYVKGYKRKVCLASNRKNSPFIRTAETFIRSMGIRCEVLSDPIEAESRSITTYVHPPFFLNDFSLQEIFSDVPSRKYMYKLFPEGPITQHAIREMVDLWLEVSELVRFFGGRPINLLQFLNDDNYPVHEETLSRADIETFAEQERVRQEYLLYIRYSSILIDPFSEPDEAGKYYDFSAFPYRQAVRREDGLWELPRVPLEDYKRLRLLHRLASQAGLAMPQAEAFLTRFEKTLREHPPVPFADTSADEADIILREWRRGR